MSGHQSSSKTAELWIRSFAPASAGPTRERALERLDSLESAPSIDAVTVDGWGPEFERTEHVRRIPQLRKIEDRVRTFESWAARTGRSLQPFFRRRRVESAITGERRDVRRLPTIALAEFVDDELVHVAPCRDGERTIDVFDRLDALERGEAVDPVVTYEEKRHREEAISDRTRPSTDGPRPPSPGSN
ncbi:HTH domain-containing protein [Halosolutus gelatinilyticus]|uniref:HTH domain-containing protein n=1 Tax=Halosolutus gelatinilyticus TaxID=2931975 RepID=UPI001FF4C5C6|nr:HTH domain-containing protein [Halosolutus gelatinilyticus]